ncbi:MAG: hypothetical protein NC083_08795 [Muribaculum sp.]|nr:hypothetical protein [Muribaculum sp.]MCM1577055.1 hypothetical protein [Bacteroides sp.]
MTNLEALRALMRPYELSEDTCQILLMQQDLEPSDEYFRDNDKPLYQAVVNALYQLMTLIEESDNGSKQKYDISLIQDLINRYRRKYDLEDEQEEKSLSSDFTPYW